MKSRVSDREISGIDGFFWPTDWDLFRLFLRDSARQNGGGDLLEVGAQYGRSAVVIGESLRPDERFTVVDLFGDPAPTADNTEENDESYKGLTEEKFIANFRRVHGEIPHIIRGASTGMEKSLPENSYRFAHIDAGHLFEQVREDLLATRTLVKPQGIVVADDWRTIHAPGVGAAIWNLVENEGLQPICVSWMKFYLTWGDPEPYRATLDNWLSTLGPGHYMVRRDSVFGRPLTMLTDQKMVLKRNRRAVFWDVVRQLRRK